MHVHRLTAILFVVAVLGFVLSLDLSGPDGPPSATSTGSTAQDPTGGEPVSSRPSALIGTFTSPTHENTRIHYALTLRSDATTILTTTRDASESETETGSWAVRAGEITLTFPDAPPLTFSQNAQTLRLATSSSMRGLPDKLILIRHDETEGESPPLVDTRWRWQQTVYPDRELVPTAPEEFTVHFATSSQLTGSSDCGPFGSRYRTTPEQTLSLSALASAPLACPENALGPRFQADLARAERYRFDGDTLILELDDGSKMEFVADT